MNVKELVTTWGFDVDTKPLEQMDERLDVLKASVKVLSAEIIAVVGTVWLFVTTTARAGNEAKDLAQELGTTTREIQRLQYAARTAGVDEDQMQMGLRRISQAAVSASQGAQQTNYIFGQLGISIYDANGKLKTSTQLLGDVAESFHRMPDGAQKTTFAIDLLGRTGSHLIPILNGGRASLKSLGNEGERMGYVMGDKAIQWSALFMEAWHRVELIIVSLKRSVGEQFLPVMTNLLDQFAAWYKANKDFINLGITKIVEVLVNAFIRGADGIMAMVTGLRKVLEFTGALNHLKEILVIIAGLFAFTTMATAMESITSLISLVMKLVKTLQLAAVMEAIATGGASLWLGLAAGGAAMLATGYLMSGSGMGGSGSGNVTLPALPSAPNGPSSSNTSSSAHIENHFAIDARPGPGTSAQQAAEIAKKIPNAWWDVSKAAAASFATPTPESFK